MNARFYVPGAYASGDLIDLPADEAQHLARVLRLRAGDMVRVFDGRGHEFHAEVASVSKNAARIHVNGACEAAAEAGISIVLAHAVLKGDKMDDVIRDAVMMGVAAIQPVVTTRTEVTLTALQRGARRERWTRVAISSAKQCGSAVIPEVREPLAFDAVVERLRHVALPQPAVMLVEPSAAATAIALREMDAVVPREATLVIGPEGGWTGDEITEASAVSRLVTLGRRTLRADAMATVAMAALFALWKEF